ncbi:MAG: hypothetical protein M1833_002287 [Piccolia ochrophora]|nr:MAG: hypothetical protein M1833_002287 [Piccolia ochrophora]
MLPPTLVSLLPLLFSSLLVPTSASPADCTLFPHNTTTPTILPEPAPAAAAAAAVVAPAPASPLSAPPAVYSLPPASNLTALPAITTYAAPLETEAPASQEPLNEAVEVAESTEASLEVDLRTFSPLPTVNGENSTLFASVTEDSFPTLTAEATAAASDGGLTAPEAVTTNGAAAAAAGGMFVSGRAEGWVWSGVLGVLVSYASC